MMLTPMITLIMIQIMSKEIQLHKCTIFRKITLGIFNVIKILVL